MDRKRRNNSRRPPHRLLSALLLISQFKLEVISAVKSKATSKLRGAANDATRRTTSSSHQIISWKHIEADIFSSELDNETDGILAHNELNNNNNAEEAVSEWYSAMIELAWESMPPPSPSPQNNDVTTATAVQKNRSLTVEGGYSNSGTWPFLVCSGVEDQSGYMRGQRLRPSEAANLITLMNRPEETCFLTGMDVQKAADLSLDESNSVGVVPLTHTMKLSVDTVSRVQTSMANGELVRILAKYGEWVESVDDELVDSVLADIQSTYAGSSTSASGRKLSNTLHQTVLEAKAVENAGDVAWNAGSERALLWSRALSEGIEADHGCSDLFSGLWYEIDESKKIVRFVLASDEFTTTPSTASEECVISFLASLVAQQDVISVSSFTKVKALNAEAQWITQGRGYNQRPWFDSGLTGKGQVIAFADTGLDTDNCYFWDATGDVTKSKDPSVFDPSRRKVIQYVPFFDSSDAYDGHGTHVAGILAGRRAIDGKNESTGIADGMARDAKLSFFDMGDSSGDLDLPWPLTTLLEPGERAGAKIHSGSWGREADYDVIANAFDEYAYNDEDFLFVAASGNDGHKNNFGSIIEPGNAKNVLTVGASHSGGSDLYNYDLGKDYVAYFSSLGPTADGRMKPDVVAPGRTLLSAGARPNVVGECDGDITFASVSSSHFDSKTGLAYMQGTSMATPVVAGTAAQVRQYFQEGFYPLGSKGSGTKFTPSGSLIKAILMNGSQAMKGLDNVGTAVNSAPYDNIQGFGRVSLQHSLRLSGANEIGAKVIDRQSIDGGNTQTYQVSVPKGSCNAPLSATLVWADPPAAAGCKNCVLNDLDLTVTNAGGTIYYPNAKGAADKVNNVERVKISAVQGQTYTVSVSATNLSTASQNYALVITGCMDGFDDNTSGFSGALGEEDSTKELTTNFDSSKLVFGNMFDIEVKTDVSISGFDVHIQEGEQRVMIWQKSGTYQGFEVRGGDNKGRRLQNKQTGNPDWEKVGTFVVKGAGVGNPTTISLSENISISAGETHAFYITTDEQATYSGGGVTAQTVASSNDDLIIYNGSTSQYRFKKPFSGFEWNGTIHYETQ